MQTKNKKNYTSPRTQRRSKQKLITENTKGHGAHNENPTNRKEKQKPSGRASTEAVASLKPSQAKHERSTQEG